MRTLHSWASWQVGLVVVSGLAGGSVAQPTHTPERPPVYRESVGEVLLPTGAQGTMQPHELVRLWRPICGTPAGTLDVTDLQNAAVLHDLLMLSPDVERVSRQGVFSPRTGLDVVFNVSLFNAPSGAAGGFSAAEAYLESTFTNTMTLTINVSFAPLAGNTRGVTSASLLTDISYPLARESLVNRRDADDYIQIYLPADRVPTRFNKDSATVTNVEFMDWPISLYNATIALPGQGLNGSFVAATIQLNSTLAWDVDPSNGITSGQYSLVDVIVHEMGHALGFLSKADLTEDGKLFPMDLFRVPRTNRTSLGINRIQELRDFTTIAREVDFDSPNSSPNSLNTYLSPFDIYRMSDGSPYAANHLSFSSAEPEYATGLMEPVFSTGVTFAPSYFRAADRNVLDAMGWNLTRPITRPWPTACKDWNGDVWADILFDAKTTSPPGAIASVRFQGDRYAGWAAHPVAAPGWRRVKIDADMNGDFIPDIVWRYGSTTLHAVWIMNEGGTSVVSWYYLPPLPDANFEIQAATYFDDNYISDLVLRNPVTGYNAIWFFDQTGYIAWLPMPGVTGAAWSIAGAGTTSGASFLLWRNAETGANYIWTMYLNEIESSVQIPTAPPGWVVKGLGDWNGDNSSDIFWWNTTTGATAFWFMNNHVYQRWSPGPSFSPSAWE